jgi:hypothetical protein
MIRRPTHRRGAALVWALAILAVLGVTSGVAVREFSAARRTLSMRENRIQAEWLARGGVELAVGRLLANPDYTGEAAEPLKNAAVQIGVTKDGDSFVIRSVARFPADDPRAVTWTVSRKAARKTDGKKVSVVLTAGSGAPPAP